VTSEEIVSTNANAYEPGGFAAGLVLAVRHPPAAVKFFNVQKGFGFISPTASRAYAWSSPIEGSDKRRFFAVLHQGPIKSPADAVRAAIVAERRQK
jgi:hypothetical protein